MSAFILNILFYFLCVVLVEGGLARSKEKILKATDWGVVNKSLSSGIFQMLGFASLKHSPSHSELKGNQIY